MTYALCHVYQLSAVTLVSIAYFLTIAIALLVIMSSFIPTALSSVFVLISGVSSIFPVNCFLWGCLSGPYLRLVDAVGPKGVGKIKISEAIRFGRDNKAIEITTIIIIENKALFFTFFISY